MKWTETCMLTRTVIYPGEQVVMVVPKVGLDPWWLTFASNAMAFLDHLAVGELDQAGWLVGLDGGDTMPPSPYPGVSVSTYHQRGCRRSLFTRKFTWDAVQKVDLGRDPGYDEWPVEMLLDSRMKGELAGARAFLGCEPDEALTKLIRQWLKVQAFCQRNRIDMSSGRLFKRDQPSPPGRVDLSKIEQAARLKSTRAARAAEQAAHKPADKES